MWRQKQHVIANSSGRDSDLLHLSGRRLRGIESAHLILYLTHIFYCSAVSKVGPDINDDKIEPAQSRMMQRLTRRPLKLEVQGSSLDGSTPISH